MAPTQPMLASHLPRRTKSDRAEAPIHRNLIPAVVVGAAGPCGLGIARSLGRAGISVILADPNLFAPAMHTRFARRHVISALAGRPLVKDLLTLSATIDGLSMLFLTSDEAVMTISECRAELEDHYRIRLPSPSCLTSLIHKPSFQQLAESHGFRLPRSASIRQPSDLRALDALRFPCIVKPAIKTSEYFQHQFARAYKVVSREHAETVCCRILPIVPDLVVQEWIEGGDDNIYFCLQYVAADGRTVCSFTGRKLSIWPPDVGVTVSCTAAPEANAILRPLTEAFFRKVGFVGMGGMEFKKDARTGEFLMIEPTVGRVDGQAEVATAHGANLPLAAYCYELGLAVPSVDAISDPVIWQDSLRHWQATRGGRPKQDAMPRRRVYAYWRANDPMPALVHGLDAATKWVRGRF